MRYTIRHLTRFTYETAITESMMEARMQPRSDARQRCLHFALTTEPSARVLVYQDHDGNAVHHFDIPGRHACLTLTAEALVDCSPPPTLPESLSDGAWGDLDTLAATGELVDCLSPSTFARPTPLLAKLSTELNLARTDDLLRTVERLMLEMYTRFEYSPRSTRVDSPVDDALTERRGVCQDFAHIFIALLRLLGVPARYVSGYLFPDAGGDRSAETATHAWVDVLLPGVGWVGFDPTNNVVAGERHVRVAIGRDYADVPPTRGVYKGMSSVRGELAVSVRVGSARTPAPLAGDAVPFTPWTSQDAARPLRGSDQEQHQQ